jgi:hypothetical protein
MAVSPKSSLGSQREEARKKKAVREEESFGGGHGGPPLQALCHYISAAPAKETRFLVASLFLDK